MERITSKDLKKIEEIDNRRGKIHREEFEKEFQTEQNCKMCKNNQFKYLKNVYSDGSDEIVCSKCKFGIKIKTIE